MGTIVHKSIAGIRAGTSKGELTVSAEWVMPDGTLLLREHTRFVFRGARTSRAIDRITT